MEQQAKNFWQDHSDQYLEMALSAEKRQKLHQADGHGTRTGDCGDTIEIFLIVKNDTIVEASFDCQGCLNTVACANTIVHMIEGKPLEEGWQITPETVIEYLGTLPSHEHHCAELAVGALYLALADARQTRDHSWKKLYR